MGANSVTAATETLELLLRVTEKNGHTIALVYPDESADFVRGYVAGQIDALRLALEHVRDTAERLDRGKDLAS
jgi:hypothetical protein